MSKRKAKHTPLCDGLSLRTGSDGHWLSFEASNGQKAMINIEAKFPGLAGSAILQWALDMHNKAKGN